MQGPAHSRDLGQPPSLFSSPWTRTDVSVSHPSWAGTQLRLYFPPPSADETPGGCPPPAGLLQSMDHKVQQGGDWPFSCGFQALPWCCVKICGRKERKEKGKEREEGRRGGREPLSSHLTPRRQPFLGSIPGPRGTGEGRDPWETARPCAEGACMRGGRGSPVGVPTLPQSPSLLPASSLEDGGGAEVGHRDKGSPRGTLPWPAQWQRAGTASCTPGLGSSLRQAFLAPSLLQEN